jgi:hypothetical protein
MDDQPEKTGPRKRPYEVRLPGFTADRDIGLGDAVKKLTYAAGITPCGGCERRAAALNRWVRFAGRTSA